MESYSSSRDPPVRPNGLHILSLFNLEYKQPVCTVTDLHSYVITQKPDIIGLQEVGPEMPRLKGYVTRTW